MTLIELFLNGERVSTRAADLQAFLLERGFTMDRAFACALNNMFVPRQRWAQQPLQPDDRLDVVAPIAGG